MPTLPMGIAAVPGVTRITSVAVAEPAGDVPNVRFELMLVALVYATTLDAILDTTLSPVPYAENCTVPMVSPLLTAEGVARVPRAFRKVSVEPTALV